MLKQLMAGAAGGQVSLHVSPIVLAEVWWGMARALYEGAHGRGSMSHPQWKVAAVPPEFGCYATLTC